MSSDRSTPTDTEQYQELTADERDTFERLAERDDDIGEIASVVLQSDSDSDNEVTSS